MSESHIILVNAHDGKRVPVAPESCVVLSSTGAGWDGLTVEHHRFPSVGETSVAFSEQHLLGMLLTPMRSELRSDGRIRPAHFFPGDGCVYERGKSFQHSWRESGEVLHIALDSELVARAAPEVARPESIAFMERHGSVDRQIQHIAFALKAELETGCLGGRLYGEALGIALAIRLLATNGIVESQPRSSKRGLSRKALRCAVDYIHDHLGENPSLAEIASAVNLSPYHFTRLFKESTGQAPHQYVIQVRLEEARRLLLSGALSTSEVAHLVGFADQSHLTRHFKRVYNVTPKLFAEHNCS
jgi:AraC family transcriptional regulator